jgi:integrase
LADSFKADLQVAAKKGAPFHVDDGLPDAMRPKEPTRSWLDHAVAYVDMKWPAASARHRKGIAEALTDITLALASQDRRRPDEDVLRRVLYRWAFSATARKTPLPEELLDTWAWLERSTPALDELAQPARLRTVLERLALRQDGRTAAASTVARKRATLSNALEYAVELELFTSNPLKRIMWKAPKTTELVDPRVLVGPAKARTLLEAVWRRDPSVAAFFACMYFAGPRPAEVLSLSVENLRLPTSGWGQLLLVGSHQTAGVAWTDGWDAGEERELKHRGKQATRSVPAHPELVEWLHRHLNSFDTGVGGRLFVARTGRAGVPISPPYAKPVDMGTVYRAWHRARAAVLSEREFASMLARRPYDLRHACLSTWLNAGVAPAQVAEWAGHSVDVLLRVYTNCVEGDDEIALKRIEAALR